MGARLLGIFLLSASILSLQVSLTRVLSVSLWYHFGFLVISTAILGFGAAGSLLSVWPWLRERAPLDRAAALLSSGFGAGVALAYAAMQRVPFAPFSLLDDPAQAWWTPLYLLLIAAPHVLAGLAVALLLSRGGAARRLYAADLVGAGAGAALVLALLPALGGSGAVIASGALAALAGVVLAAGSERRLALGLAGLAALLTVGAVFADSWAPVRLTANKTSRELPVAWTRWDAFSRVDLIEKPGRRIFRIDGGTALTGVVRPAERLARRDGPALRELSVPFAALARPRVLVIGSGAGAEVVEALRLGAKRVTALEINPLIADAVREDPFWGGLFERPDVELHAVEGRSFLRRTEERYDLIVSVHTISNAAMAAGAMDLAESYVLTREAFEDYGRRSSDQGLIYFTRPEAQMPRLVATAREQLDTWGVEDPSRHVFLWRERPRARGDSAFSAGLVLRRAPFEAAQVRAMAAALGPAPGERPRFELLYAPEPTPALPSARGTPTDIYRVLLTAPMLESVYEAWPTELRPSTDDRPFFNHRTRWQDLDLEALGDLFRQSKRARLALEDRPVAEVTLVVLLVETSLVAALLIFAPLLRLRRAHRVPARRAARWLGYFGLLGLSFIAVEIVLIQWVTLFLGRPALTFVTVLSGLLVSSGVGSALSERAAARLGPRGALALAPVALVALALFLPPLMQWALPFALKTRVALTLLAVFPVGLALGMPFPLGLARLGQEAPAFVAWAWAVNGFFTVVGTVGAIIAGMSFGFTAALSAAALGYVAVVILHATPRAAPTREPPPLRPLGPTAALPEVPGVVEQAKTAARGP